MRYAVYFTPPVDDALTRTGSAWLGRNAFTGSLTEPEVANLAAAEIEQLVAEPRRYGFHATIVAPFRLAEEMSEQDLVASFDRFCDQNASFEIEGLAVAGIDGFIALVPTDAEPELSALSAEAVNHFAPLRAPLSPGEIRRRDPERLSLRQRAYLERYGYPYVMDEFRFHMTLTGKVSEETGERIKPVLKQHLAPVTGVPLEIGGLALFVENEPGAAFTVLRYQSLSPRPMRKSA